MVASIFGLITFILGSFAGFAIYHYFFRFSNQERQILAELQQTQHSFREYQDKVKHDLKECANLIDQVQKNSSKLHDHILHASVNLNLDQTTQSILQPVLHAEPLRLDDHEDEQVTEFHPVHVSVKSPARPPRDYV